MYYAVIQQFARTLGNLDTILDKAAQSAEARKFDPNNFCAMRLAPNMFPFTRQIQVACDVAKTTAANLAGKEAPKHEDTEQTLADCKARIRKCLGYLETFRPDDFARTNAQTVIKLNFPQGKAMHADEYLLARCIPNFYFHVTTAYDLLRQGGVEIGKMDYLGQLPLLDA